MTSPPQSSGESPQRSCGACSLCCTVLRVDELGKPAGVACRHLQAETGGCGVYETRPAICRAYRCLWLKGGLGEGDRPDRLGAVLDLFAQGTGVRLEIREAVHGAFDRSARLQEIAAQYRESMPVRITDVDDVLNPDRPFRVLLAGGEENRVMGETVEVYQDGERVASKRLWWLERLVRRIGIAWRRLALRRLRARGRGDPRAK